MKPVPTFWQVAQSGVLRADLSKAITERKRSEDRDHRDTAVQDAVPRFEWCTSLCSCARSLVRGPSETMHDDNLIVWACHVIAPLN